MISTGNYIYIDGSALTAQIRQLRKADKSFNGRKLCPREYIHYLMMSLVELHNRSYKRATFYFPKGDDATPNEYLRLPDFRSPGVVRDLHLKFCGEKLKKSEKFKALVEAHIPAEFLDRIKTEKGVDVEICCDALKLASAGRMDRLFLLTNDRDFIPLCRTLKEFGANVSLIHLSEATSPSIDLLNETDSYDVIPIPNLQNLFYPRLDTPPPPPTTSEIRSAEKPDTEPSDLKKIAAEPEPEGEPVDELEAEEISLPENENGSAAELAASEDDEAEASKD